MYLKQPHQQQPSVAIDADNQFELQLLQDDPNYFACVTGNITNIFFGLSTLQLYS